MITVCKRTLSREEQDAWVAQVRAVLEGADRRPRGTLARQADGLSARTLAVGDGLRHRTTCACASSLSRRRANEAAQSPT